MPDRLELARQVFAAFQYHYERETKPGEIWSLPFRQQGHEVPGLTLAETQIGAKVLLEKKLIQFMGTGAYRLTELGKDACLHPETLNACLGPRYVAPVPQSVTINAENMQHTQVGHGNTQNIVTYSAVLQDLREQIENAPITPEEKSSALSALDKLISHPFVQTAVSAVVSIAAGK